MKYYTVIKFDNFSDVIERHTFDFKEEAREFLIKNYTDFLKDSLEDSPNSWTFVEAGFNGDSAFMEFTCTAERINWAIIEC